jgi:hypothetical protein
MNLFREYVTSTAFALTISHRQIEMICHIHKYGHSYLLLTTFSALNRKGLVERVSNGDEFGVTVGLTEAGKAVIPLLKLAGLYITLPDFPAYVDPSPINVIVTPKTSFTVKAKP